jgi:arylsulfatase A-like enzyme
VVFTSDNGYFHGEHRLSFSKVWLYEEAVHLPLVIRGGPFPKGAKSPTMAGNVDLAPTILALAGAPKPPLTMDGRDLAKVVADPQKGVGRGMLLESWRENATKHTDGIRTERYKYLVSESHDEELYDLQADPAEMQNRAGDPAFFTLKAEMVRRLNKLRECAGSVCEGSDAAGS